MMDDEAASGLTIGDRASGFEVTGPSPVAGLRQAYRGTSPDGKPVTLFLVKSSTTPATVTSDGILLSPGPTVRFGGGDAVSIHLSQDDLVDGQTLDDVLSKSGGLSMEQAATLFVPVLTSLHAHHQQGWAHGRLSDYHLLVGKDGKARVLPPLELAAPGARSAMEAARAPETREGSAAHPAADVFSLCWLLQAVLAGEKPPSTADRLAKQAQREPDPLTPITAEIPTEIAQELEAGLKLHPAVRPQGLARLIELLEPHMNDASTLEGSQETSPTPPPLPTRSTESPSNNDTRKGPWGSRDHGPPPLPPSAPTTKRRTVPVTGRRKPSSIGAPPSAPPQAPAGKPYAHKRRLKVSTILAFLIALAVAWFVAGGGFGLVNDAERIQQQEQSAERAPSGETLDPTDTSNTETDGVLEQYCSSRFVFNSARERGVNALQDYIDRCSPIGGEFLPLAERALRN
ncbi:MAG: hypothetical protein AAGH60_06815 [Pseudomonadota bacterium]